MRKQVVLQISAVVLGFTMALLGFSGQAQALSIGTCASDLPGNCSYTVELVGNQLTMGISNTSSPINGGFITAVAFDLAGAASITGVTTTDNDFSLTGGNINVAPEGTREFVMSITGDYLGGGSPTSGISPGPTPTTFTFSLGGNITGVTEANVFSSSLVRFRGFADGGSDKDRVVVGVPESSSLLMLGAGLVGIGLWRRKSVKI